MLVGSASRGTAGSSCWREAVEVLDRSRARLQRAKARVSLGVVLREDGAGDRARELLEAGMDEAHACGADVLVEHAIDELHELGARPRRPAVAGIDALTPRQRRIAELAARGDSNREIAESEFLTRRAVEQHLTAAYRKLGISGRGELSAVLPGPGHR